MTTQVQKELDKVPDNAIEKLDMIAHEIEHVETELTLKKAFVSVVRRLPAGLLAWTKYGSKGEFRLFFSKCNSSSASYEPVVGVSARERILCYNELPALLRELSHLIQSKPPEFALTVENDDQQHLYQRWLREEESKRRYTG